MGWQADPRSPQEPPSTPASPQYTARRKANGEPLALVDWWWDGDRHPTPLIVGIWGGAGRCELLRKQRAISIGTARLVSGEEGFERASARSRPPLYPALAAVVLGLTAPPLSAQGTGKRVIELRGAATLGIGTSPPKAATAKVGQDLLTLYAEYQAHLDKTNNLQ